MSDSKKTDDKPTHMRFVAPPDVTRKIKSHQRKMSAVVDFDVLQEDAIVDFIRKAKIPRTSK